MRLTEFMFPCVTYVLRRLDIDQSPEDFVAGKGWSLTSFSEERVEDGDIVAWANDEFQTDVTLEIRNGVPVTRRICVREHYGVYEGSGLVSDMTIDGDNYAPRIRVMSVSESRPPDFIVRPVLEESK